MQLHKDGTLSINPGFSIWLATYLLFIHLAALLLIPLLQLPTFFSLLLAPAVIFSFSYYWRRDLLHNTKRSIKRVEWSKEKGWNIWQSDGSSLQANLVPSSFLSRYLVLLHFNNSENGNYRLLLPRDRIPADDHRRLRTLLKLQDHFGE